MDTATIEIMKTFYRAETALSTSRSAWFADFNSAALKAAYLAAEAAYMAAHKAAFGL